MTDEAYPDTHHDVYSKTVFGFWVYLLTDFMLFAAIFATYAVLRNSVFGGPSGKDLFDLHTALTQTFMLLTCSLTIGLGTAMAHRRKKAGTIFFLLLTFALGFIFFQTQLGDFSRLVDAGHSWKGSAFLSAYFTLVGTHTLHLFFALLWILVLLYPLVRHGMNEESIKRLTCLRMFWQFLNVIWIFIFSFVYLMGVI